MTQRIKVSYGDYAEIKRMVNAGEIIPAIKHLRDLTACGLKEGKHAIDHMRGRNPDPCARLVRPWQIETITVRDADGKCAEISLKDLELRFLQESPSIGFDAVADLLDLTEFLKKWQRNN